MTKLNYVFIVAIVSTIIGAVLLDFYGNSYTSGVLIIGGAIVAAFSGIFSLIEPD